MKMEDFIGRSPLLNSWIDCVLTRFCLPSRLTIVGPYLFIFLITKSSVNVAGESKNLEPSGADVLGINIPFGEYLNAGSFDTTYVDESIRISRSKTGPVDQLRLFIKAEESTTEEEAEVVDDDDDEIVDDDLDDDEIVEDDDDDDELAEESEEESTIDAEIVDEDDDDDEVVEPPSDIEE